nr:hypothetical protein CFP56_66768 [Quercus suber]
MRIDSVKPMAKSRLKRFFDFPSVLRNSTVAPKETMRSKFNARTKTMEVVIKTKGQTRVSKPRAVAINAIIAPMVDKRNTHMNWQKKKTGGRHHKQTKFPSVLRNSTVAPEKVVDKEPHFQKDGFNGSVMVAPVVAAKFESNFVCLDSMVQNFIEENNNNNNEKQSDAIRCGCNRCNCFNRNCIDSSSEDELDSFDDSNYSSTASSQLHLQSSIYHFVLFHKAYLTTAVIEL